MLSRSGPAVRPSALEESPLAGVMNLVVQLVFFGGKNGWQESPRTKWMFKAGKMIGLNGGCSIATFDCMVTMRTANMNWDISTDYGQDIPTY